MLKTLQNYLDYLTFCPVCLDNKRDIQFIVPDKDFTYSEIYEDYLYLYLADNSKIFGINCKNNIIIFNNDIANFYCHAFCLKCYESECKTNVILIDNNYIMFNGLYSDSFLLDYNLIVRCNYSYQKMEISNKGRKTELSLIYDDYQRFDKLIPKLKKLISFI